MPSNMRLATLVLVVLFLVNLNLFQTACSLDRKLVSGFELKLAPTKAERFGLPDLFEFATLSTPTSLSDLNCFMVNARGGAIPTTSACSGALQRGVIDGMRSGIDSVFQLNIPVAEGLAFDAFGMS